jgi:hypothetical protein
VRYRAFTLLPNDCFTDEDSSKCRSCQRPKMRGHCAEVAGRNATHFGRLRRRCHEWMSKTRNCFSASCRDSKTQRKGSASRLRSILLWRLSENVGKHSFEYFASDFVRVFFRRVLRLGFFAYSGRFRVWRFRFFRKHRNTTKHIVARPNRQFNTLHHVEPFRTAVSIPSRPSGYDAEHYAAASMVAALRAASGGRNTIVP